MESTLTFGYTEKGKFIQFEKLNKFSKSLLVYSQLKPLSQENENNLDHEYP